MLIRSRTKFSVLSNIFLKRNRHSEAGLEKPRFFRPVVVFGQIWPFFFQERKNIERMISWNQLKKNLFEQILQQQKMRNFWEKKIPSNDNWILLHLQYDVALARKGICNNKSHEREIFFFQKLIKSHSNFHMLDIFSVFEGFFTFWTFGPKKIWKFGQRNFQGKVSWTYL